MRALWDVDAAAGLAALRELEQAFAAAVSAATPAGAPADPTPRAVLRAAVLRHVQDHLPDSPVRDQRLPPVRHVAAHLHNLFAEVDGTFAATVRGLRLDRCARALADLSTTGTIAEIAAAHGFDDPTTFTRAFRRRSAADPPTSARRPERPCTECRGGVHALPGHPGVGPRSCPRPPFARSHDDDRVLPSHPRAGAAQGCRSRFARDHLRELAAAVRAEPDPLTRALLLRPTFEKAVAAGFLKGLIPRSAARPQRGRRRDLRGGVGRGEPGLRHLDGRPAHRADARLPGRHPEQIERFVAPFLADSGAPLAAMAYSEPEGSANFAAEGPGPRTTAELDGDEWVINGRKAWASHLWLGRRRAGRHDHRLPDPGGISLIVAEREHLAGRIEVEEYYDLPGLKGAPDDARAAEGRARPPSEPPRRGGPRGPAHRNAFFPSGASIGIFAVAAMRQAFDIAYRFALTETRGGPVPIIEYQAVSDVLADAKGRIEAVRLLSWRALDAVMPMHLSGPELALHAKIFGSETGVDVINKLIEVVGVTAYDERFLIVRHLLDALSYPVIEGSNVGVRRRQLQALFTTPGYDPLSASGMA